MKINIVCDLLQRSEYLKRFEVCEKAVYLSSDSQRGNVYLNFDTLARDLASPLDSLSLDLCEIAAYIYLADKAFPRGDFDNWDRDLSFLIPVRNPAKWNSVTQLLRYTVATLTGDNVQFHFIRRKEEERTRKELYFCKQKSLNKAQSDGICLFSGGLDSLAGAVYLLQQGRQLLFVSHYVNAVLKNLQSNLISGIQVKGGSAVEHLQYRVTSKRLRNTQFVFKAKDSSHRARSFLFMSFGAVAAAARRLKDIYICENGVLALNVPISEARKGSRSTRHAHPLYLQYFNQLINQLYERSFSVQNPFLYWTKGKEAELLKENGFSLMIKNTVSCWGYPNQTIQFKDSNHCGYCIPCIIRRVSVAASGLEPYDDHYNLDVFSLKKGGKDEFRKNINDLMYFCQFISSHSIGDVIYRYPEFIMIETHQDPSSGDKVAKIIEVYKKFAEEVLEFAKKKNSFL